jgi:hypothetical protein
MNYKKAGAQFNGDQVSKNLREQVMVERQLRGVNVTVHGE